MTLAKGRRPPRTGVGVRSLRWSLRNRMAEHPGYLRLIRRRYGESVVSEDTELVIDGFTRSASTFAVVAFQLSQPAPVRVGHHLHAPSQILAAVRRGVPTLLTVRSPEDSVLSLVIREPYVSIPQGLNAYARFHERLLRQRSDMVVADFSEVTTRFDHTIERVNARFGRSFAPFVSSGEATQRCFELIELRARRPPWHATIRDFLSGLVTIEELEREMAAQACEMPPLPEERAQRPSAYKEARKDELRVVYHERGHGRLRRRAERLYAVFAEEAGFSPSTTG